MPLYEYTCRGCGGSFETLVRTGDTPACPACQSRDLERLASGFAVTTAGRSYSRLQDARAAHARGQRDKRIADREARERHEH